MVDDESDEEDDELECVNGAYLDESEGYWCFIHSEP